MTDKETAKIMAVLKVAYPRYYQGLSAEAAKQAVTLWTSMLIDYSYELVSKAVKALIATEKFPPTVADVIEKINLVTTRPQLSEVEAWYLVKKAIRNSGYHSQEEFDKLPMEVQAAVGNAGVLREWCMVDESSVETVVGSNFMRSYRSKIKQTKELMALPSDVKEFMQITTGAFDLTKAIENKRGG